MASSNIITQYDYKGVKYTVVGTRELHNKIQEDADYANYYFSRCAKSMKPAELGKAADSNDSSNEDSFQWTKISTFLLIEMFEAYKDQFTSPDIKKKDVWGRIQKEFMKKGYTISVRALDTKFKNMRRTFKAIKNKLKEFEGTQVRWEYFDIFQRLMGDSETDGDFSSNSQALSSKSLTPKRSRVYITVRGQGQKDPLATSDDESPACAAQSDNDGSASLPLKRRAQASAAPESDPHFHPLPLSSSPRASGEETLIADFLVGSEEIIDCSSTSSRVDPASPPQESTETSAVGPAPQMKRLIKMKRSLFELKRRRVEIEEEKLEEMKKLRQSVEEQNALQRETNKLLLELVQRNKEPEQQQDVSS